MKYNEILERIEGLDKDEIIIYDNYSRNYSSITLHYKGVRILDLRRPQMKKLQELGYEVERRVV